MMDRRNHLRKIRMVKSKMASTWMVLMNSDSHKKEVVPVAVVAVVKDPVAAAVVEDQAVAAKMAKKWTQPEEAMANPPRASMMLLKAATKPSEQKAKARTRRA